MDTPPKPDFYPPLIHPQYALRLHLDRSREAIQDSEASRIKHLCGKVYTISGHFNDSLWFWDHGLPMSTTFLLLCSIWFYLILYMFALRIIKHAALILGMKKEMPAWFLGFPSSEASPGLFLLASRSPPSPGVADTMTQQDRKKLHGSVQNGVQYTRWPYFVGMQNMMINHQANYQTTPHCSMP